MGVSSAEGCQDVQGAGGRRGWGNWGCSGPLLRCMSGEEVGINRGRGGSDGIKDIKFPVRINKQWNGGQRKSPSMEVQELVGHIPEKKPGLSSALGLLWTGGWVRDLTMSCPTWNILQLSGVAVLQGAEIASCALPSMSNTDLYFCFKPCQPHLKIIRRWHSSVAKPINLLQIENVQ